MKVLKVLIFSVFYHTSAVAQTYSDVSLDMNVLFQSNTSFGFGPNGVSFFDFNNDGWDDITFVQETDSQVFYINNEGVFEKLPSFLYSNGETKQVLWVDYDNDGDYDILVSVLYGPIKLYENDGNFNFTDVSVQAGLSPVAANNFGVSFGDYDKDGFLDFYVCRYVGSGDSNDITVVNNLYHNNGDGTFTNVTFQAGVADGIAPSFQAVWIDYDKDSWPDLFVINDRNQWGNSLYKNNGDGTFTNVAIQTDAELFAQDPMTATVGDFDNDGDLDIYMTNTALFPGPQHKKGKLLVNKVNETNNFKEEAEEYGVDIKHYSWGATWVDFNNDTYQDLYVTTSRFSPLELVVRSYMYVNNEGSSFIDSPTIFQNNHIARSFAVAKGDIDNDGYADLVVVNTAPDNAFLWKNSGSDNNYVKITLEGVFSNKMAIGSWIYVFAGGNRYTHYTMCGENFASQNSQHHIFGLGGYDKVDSILVEYPSGLKDKYYNLDVNEHYYFTEGETFIPQITVLGNAIFCEGDSVILDAGEYLSYEWNNGSLNRFLTVKHSGFYNVVVEYDQDSFYTSNTIEVNVKHPPIIQANILEISCFNANDGSIHLNIETEAEAYELEWLNTQLGSYLENLEPGTYAYIYTDEYGCVAEDSIALTNPSLINVQTLILEKEDTALYDLMILINGAQSPYEIYLNEVQVTNEIEDLLAGIYSLKVIDANACEYEMSIEIKASIINSIVTNSEIDFKIWPNPIEDSKKLTVQFNTRVSEGNIKCVNTLGEVMFDIHLNDLNKEMIEINFNNYMSKGVYYIIFSNKSIEKIKPIVVK